MIFEHKLTTIKISELKLDPGNPNKMNIEQMAGLRKAMERFGYLSPIIIDQHNKIADGEHRVLIYKEFNLTEIPCYKITFSNDTERMLLRQTMNKLRGQHEPGLDAEEMAKLYEAHKLPDLSNLIAQNEQTLKELMLNYKTELPLGHGDDQQLDQLIDEQLTKIAPDTKLADRYQLGNHQLICSDNSAALPTIPDNSIDMVITSPPYWGLRDYKEEGQIGLESTPQQYIAELMGVFNEVKRILKPTGSCWINIGDSYSNKSLELIPQRLIIALTDQGWLLRNTIIWYKPNAMPSSASDRFTIDFEYLFFFTKNQEYYFDTQYEDLESINISGWERQRQIGIDTNQYKTDYNQWGKPNPFKHNKNMPKFGGNRAAGYENPTYSGKQWNPSRIPMDSNERKNAIALGWDGKSDYADWYFNKRQRKGWTNHSHDKEQGLSHQTTQTDTKLRLAFPYGRIKRCVWKISTQPSNTDVHFAVFPIELLITPIKATCPPDGVILDPFVGSGTTIIAAEKFNRKAIGIELSPRYCDIAIKRWENYTNNKAARL